MSSLSEARPIPERTSDTTATIMQEAEAQPDQPAQGSPLQQVQSENVQYPPLKRVVLIMLGLFITAFLVALDRTIIATAIPRITDEFNSLGDVGWYASAYMLTMCGFQLSFGRVYTFYNPKYVYICTIILFEIGSAICGSAPSSTVFIIGRAIAGIGSAGIFGGAVPIFIMILPLDQRPKWTAIFGIVFGIASVAGPLLGGVLTDKVSWRWCFYINLPFGAVVIALLVVILRLPPMEFKRAPWKQQIMRLDPIGLSVFLPSMICLLLALQWGGTTYSWGDARIIALLVLSAVLLPIFVAIQIWRGQYATVPPHIIKNRNIAFGMFFTFCTGSAMMVFVYFLPIWFQAIKGVSAVKSGIMNVPLVLSLVVASLNAGLLTKRIGYYTQWIYACSVIMPIGAGMLTTFTTTTGHAKWIGYQVIFGYGLGLGMQQPILAAQSVLPRKDVATGASLLFFTQSLGGSVATSISNNIFDNKLAEKLSQIPGLDVGAVGHVGATDLRKYVPEDLLPSVLVAYNFALRNAFYVGLGMSSVLILGAAGMEWKSILSEMRKSANPKEEKVTDIEATAISADPTGRAEEMVKPGLTVNVTPEDERKSS